jgi:ApbE superfamily uncharacterized protein (UPF0280 family)
MSQYKERTYRRKLKPEGLVSFSVAVKETDLWVCAESCLEDETRNLILDARHQLEAYLKLHPGFITTLSPVNQDPYAPPVVKEMIKETGKLNIGPMASVAGAIAQKVGRGLLNFTEEVIVENGGDIFLKTARPITISLFAGNAPLSEKFALTLPPEKMPLGVCSSSATIGHSLSLGITDLACVLSPSVALADAAATAFGNRIKNKTDLTKIKAWAEEIVEIMGVVVIVNDQLAAWGDIELTEL